MSTENDAYLFADEDEKTAKTDVVATGIGANPWHILIVDDEQSIHDVTQLAIGKLNYLQRGLHFFNAYSAQQAKVYLAEHKDIALVLLDVVMESQDAGLQLVKYIRETLNNKLIRIILRTGQPGEAPELSVIMDYDINDYKEKTELTRQKLITSTISSLRAYRDLSLLEKQRQELVLAKRAATVSERTKNAFLSNLSHEIRTPLNAIMGFSQIIREEAIEQQLSSIQAHNKHVYEAGEHLGKLFSGMLELSKMQAQQLIPQPNWFSLGDLLEEVSTIPNTTWKQQQNNHFHQINRCGIDKIHSDYYFWQQIFSHLIDNANKFTKSGNIYIELSNYQQDQSSWLCFVIRDTGIGIDKSQLDYLFQHFTQANERSDRVHQGTGIGLALVKSYCDSLGGEITIQSRLNEGTTVTVKLPCYILDGL